MAVPDPVPTPLTLVLGGARSGKSTLAERLAERFAAGGTVHYVATAVPDPEDRDFAARIDTHRARRGERFRTVEAGDDLPGALRALPPGAVLIEALGTWLASPAVTPTWATTRRPGADFDRVVAELLDALAARRGPTVVVSDEAGLGVHPEHLTGRRWRDALGILNQCVAELAGDVWLVVAGRVLPLTRAAELDLPEG
jgi:adenosyl cobinamide kinase/adenosyl cobinamide phosphate guanylyltransferase